ncbi:MAG: hypothetical protein V1495_07635 [Pseudomonadota bacterium]
MKKVCFALLVLLLFSPRISFAEKGEVQAIQSGLQDVLRIYLVRPDRRSQHDIVTVKEMAGGGYSAEISYWRSLKARDSKEEICNAYRWLLLGRGVYANGAVAAFEKFPSLSQIYLKFVDVESATKVGKKRAEIVPTEKVIPYLRIGVARNSLLAKRADWNAVKADLDKGKCAEVAKSYLDLAWTDSAYLKQGQ